MELLSLLAAFFPFAFIAGLSPGPNNFMLAASAANFGYRRTVPHILGIIFGFAFLTLVVGLGLGGLLTRYPLLHTTLKFIGAGFLFYLAWRIAFARAVGGHEADARPLTFMQAALFQWVNPKAWMINIAALGTYTTVGGNTYRELGVILGGFFIASLFCTNVWALFGVAIERAIGHSGRAMRAFNIVMGVALAATIGVMLV